MAKRKRYIKLFDPELVGVSIKQSFVKLDPRLMIKNPVMFTVEIVTAVMMAVVIYQVATADTTQGALWYNIVVFLILLITVLFANFAEALAEARGKAQAESLRKTREETPAKKLVGKTITTTPSSQLRLGDQFICEAGDIIPMDGEIVEGIATIDESAITGESAPVIREAGGDKSSVTGGTKVLSDRIAVEVTTAPGETFLDKMIALVEGASRQKTPNEIALTILLATFTMIFTIVCVTLKPYSDYANTPITIAAFVSLFVCLIPTTIGGLLSAIGIAGMDRALRANVIAKSGKAVETAGDVDVLLLDKTGTITIGNRKATNFYSIDGISENEFIRYSALSSLSDDTPEGKSIVELALQKGVNAKGEAGSLFIKFTAETRSSGVDTVAGLKIRKGAFDAISNIVTRNGNTVPTAASEKVKSIAANGVVQPIVVRPKGDKYEIVAGERRWRAAQKAGLRKIPAAVKEVSDDKLLELALIENIQRQELNPIEEAAAFRKLIDNMRFTQEALSASVGKERTLIATSLRLLKLPSDIQSLIEDGKLSAGHGRALLMTDDVALQRRVARMIIEKGFSVRETERAVKRTGPRLESGAPRRSIIKKKDPNFEAAETKLRRRLGTNVSIIPNAKGLGGKLEIEYYNQQDLDRIYQAIIE